VFKYVLITPARNEEAFIEKTITSVINQTVRPQKWVIINDGSTDRTGDIARQYAQTVDFIDLIDVTGDNQRNFGSKSRAVNYAYDQVRQLDFDFVGNLDADVSFDPDYYKNILTIMSENPQLGLAGGARYDYKDGTFVRVKTASNSVGGPFQLFRRECFEKIGGYKVLPHGGIDAVAEITARMYGWEVKMFPDYHVYHHRATGRANRSVLSAYFHLGIREYVIGYHPLFEVVRTIKRLNMKPYLLGSFAALAGYTSALVRRYERPVPPEVIAFLHKEQKARIRNVFTGESDI
jgi:poly-beta-1,6-N-acetyl-D-glucosamine synthase